MAFIYPACRLLLLVLCSYYGENQICTEPSMNSEPATECFGPFGVSVDSNPLRPHGHQASGSLDQPGGSLLNPVDIEPWPSVQTV